MVYLKCLNSYKNNATKITKLLHLKSCNRYEGMKNRLYQIPVNL
jgi:hypothetical protein